MRQILHKGRNHVEIADSFNDIGRLYLQIEEFSEGLDYLKKAQRMYNSLFLNLPHERVAKNLLMLGIEYSRLGEIQLGLKNLKESLAMYNAIHPKKNHIDIYHCLTANGKIFFKLKEPEDIKNWLGYFTEAAERCKGLSSDKNDCPLMAWNAYCIGLAHEKLGNRKEAEKFFNEAYDTAIKIEGLNPDNMKMYQESFDRYNNFWAKVVTVSREICHDKEIC